jgi:hypothetical protein
MIHSQQESVDKKLETLFNKVYSIYDDYRNHNNNLILSRDEAEDVVKQLYDLYSFHWVETYNYNNKKYRDAEKDFKISNDNKFTQPPAVKFRVVKEAINKIMGDNFSEIIIVPYYFRVKIIDINYNDVYHSGEKTFGKTTLLCEIIDVIKGKSLFNNGEKIKISLLTGWGIGPFEVGKDYFFPVKPWNCKDNKCSEFTLNLFNNSISGFSDCKYNIYPIINNEVKNKDYFNISTSNWDDFLREFKDKYLLEVPK